MRKKIFNLIGVLFVCLTVICSCSQESDPPPEPNTENSGDDGQGTVSDGKDFTLKNSQGASVSLSDEKYKDKVVVLFFLGNTCAACAQAAPMVQTQIADAFSGKAEVIGLDQWDGTMAAVAGFVSRTQVSFPVLQKASGVASAYSSTYDRLVVLDKARKVVHRTPGRVIDGNNLAKTIEEIEKLL